jgi:hypothetical protein
MSDHVSINVAGEGMFDYTQITVALVDVMKALHWLTTHPHHFKKMGFTSTCIAARNDPCGSQGQFTSDGRSKHRLLCGMKKPSNNKIKQAHLQGSTLRGAIL